MPTTEPQTRPTVTAIIVAHDGARLLPGLVQAVQAQTHPVDQAVGADTGSRDRSGAVLAELIGPDAVVGLDSSAGFGEAVSAALRQASGRRSGPADPDRPRPRPEWIWLLHDDCEPAPEALERLLRAAGKDVSAAVLGPKVLDGQDRRTLREVGVSVDRAGRRITGIDPGEIDQGQHDHNKDVLAVGSAGMLVRRDVWDRLGGFDPRLRFFRDDLDFCWRVQAAGYRVQVVTDAVLYHRELAARRRRRIEGGNARWLDRSHALFVLAVNLPLLTMLRVVGACVIGTLLRGCYFLVTKQLDLAAAQVFAVAGLFGHPIRLVQGRRRRARGRTEAYRAVCVLIPRSRTLFRVAEQISGLVSNGPPQASGGLHQAVADEQDEQFVDTQSVPRQILGHPGVLLFVALLVIALIGERRLLSIGALGGGALVPAWGGAGALWREYLAGFHTVGLGSTASAPPYVAVVAALATMLGGQAWLAVDVLLLGCVPLAGLTAYLASRRLVTSTAARLLLAASYALLPVATGSIAAGRLGTAVAFILLPLIAVSAGRMLTAAPRQARRAAWAAGLLVAVAAAFAPLAWVLGLIFAASALAARRWLLSVNLVNAAIVAVVPFLALFPWSLHLLASPSALVTEAGLATTGLTTAGLGPSALLALSPGGPGLPPVWVTAGLGLAVLAALLPHRGRGLTIAGWIVASTGFLTAVVVRSVSLPSSGGGQAVPGWPGFALALAALGLLLATAPAAQWLAEIVKNRTIVPNGPGRLPTAATEPEPKPEPGHGRAVRVLAGLTLAAAATAPLLVASYWVSAGVRGPVGSIAAPLLPAFVSASSASGEQYRTLILRPDGSQTASSLDYLVVRQGDPTLGEPELGSAPAAERVLGAEVAALGAAQEPDAGDPGLMLGQFGIRWVLLPGPVDPVLALRLDAAVGLVALSKAPSYDLWQVVGPVARVRVVAADGTTRTLGSDPVNMSAVSAPAGGGSLVLAEPYGGWTATLNGSALKPLSAPVDGWAQGFVLPAGGGRVAITRDNLARDLSLIAELIAVLAIVVLALPGKRADPAQEAQALAALREARHGRRAADATAPGPDTGAGRRPRAGDLGRVGASLGAGLAGPYRVMTRRPMTGKPRPRPLGASKHGAGRDMGLDSAEFQETEFQETNFQNAEFPNSEFPNSEFPNAEFEPDAEFPEAAAADGALADATAPESDAAEGGADGRRDIAGRWDSAAPWEAGPEQRAPWESDPQAPPASAGSAQSGSWETGPQRLDPWPAGAQAFASAADRAEPPPAVLPLPVPPLPVLGGTGPQISVPPDIQDPSALPWEPAARDATEWGSGAWPAPGRRDDSVPVLADGVPADRPEPEDTAAGLGPGEAAQQRARGESAPGHGTGERRGPARSDPPAAAPREAKPERHSHRAAKHGRPSRWRGGADRAGGNGRP